MTELNPELAAKCQIAWWTSYHLRHWEGVRETVIELAKAEYGVTIDEEVADHFVKATQDYIQFKELQKEHRRDEAAVYVVSAREHMEQYYKGIENKLEELER